MSALIMFRHGKADWHVDSGDDRDRPLSRRGRRGARTMGRFLARARQVPDAAITSPALRAEQTIRLAMGAGDWTCPVREAEALYGGDTSALLDEIRREPSTTELLLVVGHEPTWSQAASLLMGGGRLRLPTAALVRIDLDVDRWAEVHPGTGELSWLVVPRLFSRGAFDFAD